MTGSENSKLDFIDLLSIASFVIALQNLDLNVTQEDAQNLQRELSEKTDLLLQEIHGHLEQQDKLLREIAERIKAT